MNKLLNEKDTPPKIINDRVKVIKKQPSKEQKVCYLGIFGDKIYIYTKEPIR